MKLGFRVENASSFRHEEWNVSGNSEEKECETMFRTMTSSPWIPDKCGMFDDVTNGIFFDWIIAKSWSSSKNLSTWTNDTNARLLIVKSVGMGTKSLRNSKNHAKLESTDEGFEYRTMIFPYATRMVKCCSTWHVHDLFTRNETSLKRMQYVFTVSLWRIRISVCCTV